MFDLDIEPDEQGIPSPEATWAERMEHDDSLKAFVGAELARAGIDAHVARLEARHWKAAAERLNEKVKELREQLKEARKVARKR